MYPAEVVTNHLLNPCDSIASPNFCFTCAPFLKSDAFTCQRRYNLLIQNHRIQQQVDVYPLLHCIDCLSLATEDS